MALQFLLRPAAHAKVVDGDGLYAIFLERMLLRHEQLMVLMIKLCGAEEGEPTSGCVSGCLRDGFSALAAGCRMPLAHIKDEHTPRPKYTAKGEKDLLTAVLIEQVVEDTAAQNPIK
jgi:hypothetical protein